MTTRKQLNFQKIGLAWLLLPALALPAAAADVFLVAKPFTKTLPDGAMVPMWGFALDADGNLATNGGETATSPGPLISLASGDGTLNIHVRNDLDVAISIVIPGLPDAPTPVKFTDGMGRERIRSLDTETAGNGGIGTYSWSNVRPGTFLYHSGTHLAVQVQMGLYGAVRKDFASGLAYAAQYSQYASEVLLLLSEIDPALHEAVDDGSYGTPAYPSTIDYRPKYFLVNGQPFDGTFSPINAGNIKQKTLLRLLNAGLEDHVVSLPTSQMGFIAENGFLSPAPRFRVAIPLTALQTVDVIWDMPVVGSYPLYDRRLSLTNADVSPGGMLVYLQKTASQQNSTKAEQTRDRLLEQITDVLTDLMDLGQLDPDETPEKKVQRLKNKLEKLENLLARVQDKIDEERPPLF